MLRHLAILVLAVGSAVASEAWFLPYEPDDATAVLWHGDHEAVLGDARGQLKLGEGASYGPGRFGEGLVVAGAAHQASISAGDAPCSERTPAD